MALFKDHGRSEVVIAGGNMLNNCTKSISPNFGMCENYGEFGDRWETLIFPEHMTSIMQKYYVKLYTDGWFFDVKCTS